MFEEEARMFAELLPAKELLAMNVSNNSITNNRCEEIKRIRQAEARKFREQLTSLAMTA